MTTNRRASLRWRIVMWITAVVLVALTSVVVISRTVLLSQVTDGANAAVEQEIEEFRRFAAGGTDPETAQPFTSANRLIEVYLSRQIPERTESFIGFSNGQLIQMDLSALSGSHPEPMNPDDPLVREILTSPDVAGVFHDSERGPAHWGRIDITAAPEQAPSLFAVAFFTAEGRAAVAAEIRTLSLLALGGLATSVLIAWLIAGQILAPVRKVREVAASISNSDLTRRVPVSGKDEIAQLAATFNAMLDRLETAYEEQRKFVDDAGHELRTPITVVRGQLELLECSSPTERTRSIELATAELDRMARMVNDLLTLAVADAGDFLHPTDVDVAELTIDIEDKGQTISDRLRLVDVAEGTVTLDEQRVTEAILELYGNALRYSDGPIDLASEFVGTGPDRVLRIWVRDHGPGIPEEQRAALFSRFARGTNAGGTHRPDGAGLGLSIVQAIGEAHGGRAFVESTVGLGSIFGLIIPAPEPAEAADSPNQPDLNM
ncbi:sensor histidine kinase [Corynebacterium mayonis]|uniref:sensor histidine kinase n=1 Tax=Corynebacterium mayonis TaxID=3062461 RepID=UPI0031403625